MKIRMRLSIYYKYLNFVYGYIKSLFYYEQQPHSNILLINPCKSSLVIINIIIILPDLAATVAIPSPMVNAPPKSRISNMIEIEDTMGPRRYPRSRSLLSDEYCSGRAQQLHFGLWRSHARFNENRLCNKNNTNHQ